MHIHTYNYNKIMNINASLRSRVIAMKLGEKLTIDVGEYGDRTLRGYAYELGFRLQRKYKVACNRESRTYTITREW